jgi:hypothetical protein
MGVTRQEPVLFEDILCQLHDMVKPAHQARFHLSDLKGCKLAGNFFNILFNLNKFIAFETRDPFVIRQVCGTLPSPALSFRRNAWRFSCRNGGRQSSLSKRLLGIPRVLAAADIALGDGHIPSSRRLEKSS